MNPAEHVLGRESVKDRLVEKIGISCSGGMRRLTE